MELKKPRRKKNVKKVLEKKEKIIEAEVEEKEEEIIEAEVEEKEE